MGMFDRVWADCPSCGKRAVEFQSKCGKCHLIDYHIDDVPYEIAECLEGEEARCDNCHSLVRITFGIKPIVIAGKLELMGG